MDFFNRELARQTFGAHLSFQQPAFLLEGSRAFGGEQMLAWSEQQYVDARIEPTPDLIKEVHPQVGELVEGMQEVVDSVRDKADDKPAPIRK